VYSWGIYQYSTQKSYNKWMGMRQFTLLMLGYETKCRPKT
jgi:hypothetical protein